MTTLIRSTSLHSSEIEVQVNTVLLLNNEEAARSIRIRIYY